MMDIAVFCILLFFVGHMDQEIETMRLEIAIYDGHQVLLMKCNEFSHRLSERVQ